MGVRGTRILVAALFEYLEDGVTMGEFVELLLDVSQEQAERVLGNVARLGGGSGYIGQAANIFVHIDGSDRRGVRPCISRR